jgi:hypothetical protein
MLLKRKTVLAAEIETTAYTAETLVAADSNFNVFNVAVSPTIPFRQRPDSASFSQRQGTSGSRFGSVTFMVDLTGNGAAGTPTWASEFFPACGWTESTGTFSPKSEAPGTNVKTLTIGIYEDGRRKILRGCAGTFRIILESGQDAMVEFTFTGAWGAVTDATILTPTYPSQIPLRFANGTFSLNSVDLCVQRVEFNAGNNVIMREDPGASDASGFKGALISDRTVTGTLDPESELVGTADWYGDWLANTERAVSAVLTDGTDTVTISVPKAQITTIAEGDRNSLRTDQITFQGNYNSAGNDEMTIDFS